MDLVKVVTEGAIRALALHGEGLGMSNDAILRRLDTLQSIVKSEYSELTNTLKDALDSNMGGDIYKHTINVFCNAWAVRALVK